MAKLTDIISEDLGYVNSAVIPSIVEHAYAFVRGLTFPYFLSSLRDYANKPQDDSVEGTFIGGWFSTLPITFGIPLGFASEGNYKPALACLGIAAITNAADYLYNAYKRSRGKAISQNVSAEQAAPQPDIYQLKKEIDGLVKEFPNNDSIERKALELIEKEDQNRASLQSIKSEELSSEQPQKLYHSAKKESLQS